MRPTDWAPLADGDPVPGDPDAVAELARRYARMAETIRAQAATLRAVGEQNEKVWDSDSGRVFAQTARVTVGKLDQVFERYAAAAKALTGYHPVLREAQTQSLAARSLAIDAHARLEKAQWNAAAVDGNIAPSLVHSVIPDPGRPAADDLAYARRKLSYAVESVDRAARAAAAQIDGVVGHDQLKDSGWQHFKAWVHDQEWIEVIADVCSKISTIAGLTALVLGCIPGLQPIAILLEGVALTFTVAAMLPHLALAITGNGSWLDLAVDTISVATFGMGRASLTVAKASTAGARASARLLTLRSAAATPMAGPQGLAKAARQAWRVLGGESGVNAAAEAKAAVAAIPKRGLPNLADLRRALDPRALYQETYEAARTAFGSPRALIATTRDSWRGASNLPQELTEDLLAIKTIPSELLNSDAVRNARVAVGSYFSWTFTGIGLDQFNNSRFSQGLKNLLTGAP